MHELLREKAADNQKALAAVRRHMVEEINAKMEQISTEQSKEVQVYLDKIKERVCPTKHCGTWIYNVYMQSLSNVVLFCIISLSQTRQFIGIGEFLGGTKSTQKVLYKKIQLLSLLKWFDFVLSECLSQ